MLKRPRTPILTDDRRAALVSLLESPRFELIPLSNVLPQSEFLPEGATVSVTASPAKGMTATVDLALELQQRGFDVIPHLSARLTSDRTELAGIIERLDAAEVTRAFIVGGDVVEPGEFVDALSLITVLEDIGHPFTELGITGYPEGHPLIADEALDDALVAKSRYADYTALQMCFSPENITDWIGHARALGVDLPVVVGIPGVYDLIKLAGLAARIGVGGSTRYLRKNTKLVGRLVRPGGYAPDGLLLELAKTFVDPIARIEALHIYTFNQVESTEAWRKQMLESLSA